MADIPGPETDVQATILKLLRDRGPRSRAELVDAVGLSSTKGIAEIESLVDLGLVEVGGPAASRGGRPSTLLQLSSRLRFVGIDVGANSVDVAVTDAELSILACGAAGVEARHGPESVLAAVTDVYEKLSATAGGELAGAGIGVPGPVNVRDGSPASPPGMPTWDRFPLRDELSRAMGGVPVFVDNDVNMMALGEAQTGVARGIDDFLFVKVGTGIGCGIVVGGEVYRGVAGTAGDIGHIKIEEFGPACSCGRSGCLEAFFSGAALARSATQAARSARSPELSARLDAAGTLTAIDVGAAAAAGDPVATEMIRDGGRRLGMAIATLVSVLNPGLVVIGGGMAKLGHVLLAEVRSIVYGRSASLATENLPIVLSETGSGAAVVGAARLASDGHLRG